MEPAFTADPPLILRSHRGGENWGDRFRALDDRARARVVEKIIVGQLRYWARKRGEPLPVLYKFKLDPNGNADPTSYRKMTRNEILKICPRWFDP
jgi:hypothetical protein